MAINNTALLNGIAVTVFEAPAQTVISTLYICNYSAANAQVDIHAIPGNAAPAGNVNVIYKDFMVGSYDTMVIDTERLILDAGDVIQVVANTNTLTATVSSFRM